MPLNAGAVIVPLVFVGFFAATAFAVRRAKFAKSTGTFTFNARYNLFLLVIVANAMFCAGSAVDLATFFQAHRYAGPSLTENYSTGGLHSAALALIFDAIFVVVGCGVAVEFSAPWDADWELHLQTRKFVTIGVQVYFLLSVILVSIARIVIFQSAHAMENGTALAATDSSAWSSSASFGVPEHLLNSALVCSVAEFFNVLLLTTWMAWLTWWGRAKYHSFACPSCHGAGDSCTDCQNGVVYHHA